MGVTTGSTIIFKSNLQIISAQSIQEDKAFLASVRDPFALEIMKKDSLNLTPVQEKEYEHASVHCSYAIEGDYPYGTIIDEDGKEKVVCKCINLECELFSVCRKDFNPEELKVSDENTIFREQVEKAKLSFFPERSETSPDIETLDERDNDALSFLYSGAGKQSDASDEFEDNKFVNQVEKSAEIPQNDNPDIRLMEDVPDATFESFISVEQNKVICLDPMQRTIVNAGPGTGKTWTLIEKIKYMLTHYDVDPENILVLCFSRAAVDVIRLRLKEASDRGELPVTWESVEVRTFDSFSTYLLVWVSENMPYLLPEDFVLEYRDYDSRISLATSVFEREKDMLGGYSHIIVDEVQDLVDVRAELVLALLESLPDSCGFTLLGDSCQALYDYLEESKHSVLSSDGFYKKLFHEFKNSNFYSFDENHRQGDELNDVTVPYRRAILLGNMEDRLREASALNDRIKKSEVNLKHFSVSKADEYTRKGTLGILTRTNGQALQISTWLRNEGTDHILQKRSGRRSFAAWIFNVVFNAKTEVISKNEFFEIFCSLYPYSSSDAMLYWEALTSAQRDSTNNYYEIEDLLKGLLQNDRNTLLFKEPQGNSIPQITVSTIHRAKGLEFDSVLIPEDVLYQNEESEKNNALEHKVSYVALTRPRKNIETVNIGTQYICIMNDQNRRCYKKTFNQKYLSHFEVGFWEDMDEKSFAFSEEIQNEIKKSVRPGDRLKLIRCPKGESKSVLYRLVPEDREKETLGYTTKEFSYSLQCAVQRIFNINNAIEYEYFPNRLGEIYVDELTTCISADDEKIKGARQYGSIYIWKGISVEGFAQVEKDRY